MKQKKLFFILFLILVIGTISACYVTHSNSDQSEMTNTEKQSEPLSVYVMGISNSYTDSEGEKIEYASAVTLGLETTIYMPGYTQGNVMIQALLDYGKESNTEIEITGFSASPPMLEKLNEAKQQGTAPDLVIVIKQFSDDFHASWLELLKESAFEDLTPYLNLASDQYYHTVLRCGRFKEKQYIVPLLFDLNGVITSEEFLDTIGQDFPDQDTSLEEWIHWLQEICIALQTDSETLALYEATSVRESYLLNVLVAAAGLYGLEDSSSITPETMAMVLEMMRDFLEQDFMTIPGYEEKSYAENSSSMQAKYRRLSGGPSFAEDPLYKRNMLGVLLNGGCGGTMINSSFIMQAYAMESFYEEENQTICVGGIPLLGSPRQYAASARILAFCPAGSDQVEEAGDLVQYLMDYDYAPEIGISINRQQVEKDLEELTHTSKELYIQPVYDPFAQEAVQEEMFNQSKVMFAPMSEAVAEQLRYLLDHIEGASLPSHRWEVEAQEQLEAYYMGKVSIEKAATIICETLERKP